MADNRIHLEEKERNRKDKCKSIRKKKRKGFPGVRRYDVVTANVDNEQQQQEGTSDASSNQPSVSSSSEITCTSIT